MPFTMQDFGKVHKDRTWSYFNEFFINRHETKECLAYGAELGNGAISEMLLSLAHATLKLIKYHS